MQGLGRFFDQTEVVRVGEGLLLYDSEMWGCIQGMVFDSQDFYAGIGLSADFFSGRGLQEYEDAEELEVVQTDEDGRVHELVGDACLAWRAMREAALKAGHELFIVSAFRSVARQAEIVRAKVERGVGVDEIFAVSAPPGFSEHHTGRAIDVSTPGFAVLEEEFEESEAFRWMEANAGSFGFRMTYPRENAFGYLYEPWHWCYVGS